MVLTEQEFLEWKEHPATKTLMKALTNEREFMKEQLVRGNVSDEAELIGRCNAILNIVALDYKDLVEGAREDGKY
jgi:ABC-type dipeptide/oligopeptide/nickel transport system ATPase component